MKRTNLILGMMLLCVAAAVAVYTTGPGEEETSRGKHNADRDPLRDQFASRGGSRQHPATPAKSARHVPGRVDLLETFRVEPGVSADPEQAQRATAVETVAKRQLARLSEDLDLTPAQQTQIFPLLARSTPQYHESLRIVPMPAGSPVDALNKKLTDNEIFKLLDPDQQIEMEIAAMQTDAWWSDVIATLEKDLVDSTTAPAAAAAATAPPEPDPDPAKEEDSTPAPAPHRGGNLFDRLNDGGS